MKRTIINIEMYTFIKNSMHLKYCYLWKCIGWLKLLCFISPSNKTSAFYLCYTYFRVLYEMHSATFIQQWRKIKGHTYFEHSKDHTARQTAYFLNIILFWLFLVYQKDKCNIWSNRMIINSTLQLILQHHQTQLIEPLNPFITHLTSFSQ